MRRRKNKGIVCAVGSKTRNAATAEPRSVKKIPDTGRERVKSLPKVNEVFILLFCSLELSYCIELKNPFILDLSC